MTILASDDFVGLGTDPLTGRSLNNALGGSGSRTWTNASGIQSLNGNNANQVVSNNAGAASFVTVTGANKARVRVDPNASANNLILWGRRDLLANGSTNGIALLFAGSASLRVSEFAAGSRTDHASLGVSTPTATYWMELEVSGLTVTCRILNNDTTVRDTVSHTFSGSVPSGGDNWGFGFFQNGSDAIFDDFIVDDGGAGPVAPTLTTPTASATSPTTSTGSVSTDQAGGTLYWLTSTSATATATAVKAGSSQSVTASGTQTTSSSGLTASTTYYTHFLHRNAGGLDSAVETSTSFTTPAPAVPPTMNGSITVGTKTSGSISISYPAASDPVGVTGYEVSSNGTTWLDNGTSLSYTFLGLVPLTSYTLSVRAYNAAGLRASPALSVTTSTYREGATGQYIVDNTGPIGDNPAGFLYDDVGLPGDANKWFSYRVTTPPADPDAITLNPDGSFIFTGLVADSFYYQLEVDGEDVGVPQPVTLTPDDSTPPVLSDPTGVATSPTTANGTVVTNESGGTLYFVTTQNATESGTTVKAGSSQAVTASGLQSVSSTSLSGATTYYNHYLHRGATGNDSLVVSSAAFTTPAVPPDPPVLSSPTATTTSATTASGTVSTTSSTGTLFILVSTNNAITDAAFWASTSKQSQPVTATGVQTVSLTALSPSTTYTAYYGQIDSFSNQSNVVKSAQFTTDAAPPSTGSKQLNISLRIGFGL